jgi:hypothetical protein
MCNPRAKKKRKRYKWSQSAREMVKSNLGAGGRQLRELVSNLVRATGYPRKACGRFARQMGVRALRKRRRWPASEQRRLLELLETHAIAEAAQTMRCSEDAIYGMLRRLGVRVKETQDFFSRRSLAKVLHTHTNQIQRWIDQGLLKATVQELGNVKRVVIISDDFCEFCQKHTKTVIGNRLHPERLEFVYKYVFPPSHASMLDVRQSYNKTHADAEAHIIPETEFGESAPRGGDNPDLAA